MEENKKKAIQNTDKKKIINQKNIITKEKKDSQTYFFKPSIDGSWLANERSRLLIESRKINPKNN
jgi:hypothetical protein